jgi:dihydroorotase
VIDPSQGIDQVTDLVIRNGKILQVGDWNGPADEVIDVTGLIVAPGLVDMHVHFREPGDEQSETVASGAAAALAGGFTSVACMPNTEPALDTREAAEFVYLQADRARYARVYPVGAVTKGRAGKELSEMGQLVEGGAVAFSDDGFPVESAEIMRRALQYARMFDKPILNHPEVRDLTQGGVMHEGFVSMRLGLPGMPAVAEEIMVARDVLLAADTDGKLHLQHLSTAGSVELVRVAKRKGIYVTAEVCPHHLALTDEWMSSFDSNFKMNPPLRTRRDVEALIEGLVDGTIDVIASDHAPHAPARKELELDRAPFGVIGLETTLPICILTLIEPGYLSWSELIAKLTTNPARILSIPGGTLRPGTDADVTVIHPSVEWTIQPEKFRSRSRNCPFAGWHVHGRAEMVLVAGEIRYRAPAVTEASMV